MASQTQRQFQDERSNTRTNDWSQRINSGLNFVADSATEEMAAPVQERIRVVQPGEQRRTGETARRATSTYAMPTTTQPVRRQQAEVSVGSRFAGASDRLGQAKPIFLFGGLSIGLLVAYLLISSVVGFVGSRIDNMGYLCDQTCTTHYEAFVGHNEGSVPTHFIGLNLHGQITVVEFPGGDASKAMTITGPFLFGQGEDKVPVQLTTSDLNGDGKADLIIAAKGAQTAYLNDGNAFRLMKPEERTAIERALSSQQAAKPASDTK